MTKPFSVIKRNHPLAGNAGGAILLKLIGLLWLSGVIAFGAPPKGPESILLSKLKSPESLQAHAQSAEKLKQMHADLHSRVHEVRGLRALQIIHVPSAQRQQALQAYRGSGLYEFVEEDLVGQPRAIEFTWDPLFLYNSTNRILYDVDPRAYSRILYQWSLHNTGQESLCFDAGGDPIPSYTQRGLPGADIGAVAAWEVRRDVQNTVVAVIDSGVDMTHPDLRENIWENTNGLAYGPGVDDRHGIRIENGHISADVSDLDGHGTEVAGIIGARGGNGIGIHGVAWNVKMMPLATPLYTASDIIVAFGYAIRHGAKVINCSWGFSRDSAALREAFLEARKAGILCVAAAVNSPQDMDATPDYPAWWNLDNVIVVTTTTMADRLYDWAGFGSNTVHLGVPGRLIVTTIPVASGGYAFTGGTSMSAAFVSGALAILAEEFPQDSYLQLRARLLNSTDKIPALNGKVQSGGRLNLHRALTSNRPRLIVTKTNATEMMLTLQYPLAGEDYTVQASSDFVNWTALNSTPSVNSERGRWNYIVPASPSEPRQFFRVLRKPVK